MKQSLDRLVFHQPVEVEHPQSAIRKGDYKRLYAWDTPEGQLFNLFQDLSEAHDLSKERPAPTTALLKALQDQVRAGIGEQACAALEKGAVQLSRLRRP